MPSGEASSYVATCIDRDLFSQLGPMTVWSSFGGKRALGNKTAKLSIGEKTSVAKLKAS